MSEKEDFSALSSIQKCPKCGGRLEKGYIHAPRGIYWDTERHKIWVAGGKAIKSMWSGTLPSAPALGCSKCKIIVFDCGR